MKHPELSLFKQLVKQAELHNLTKVSCGGISFERVSQPAEQTTAATSKKEVIAKLTSLIQGTTSAIDTSYQLEEDALYEEKYLNRSIGRTTDEELAAMAEADLEVSRKLEQLS
jgi:hypothetical protein